MLIMELKSENVSNVKLEDQEEEKVKKEFEDQEEEKVKMEFEDQEEEKVKVEFEDREEEKVKVEFEDQSMQMENTAVVEKLEVKILIHHSVVQAVESGPLVLALVDPSTGFCHGAADIRKVEEHNRKRAGRKRKYHCHSCNYSTKDKYLITRHAARIHEKTVDSKRCRFCKFSTIYPSNLTRHIQRAHSNQAICNQTSDSSRY